MNDEQIKTVGKELKEGKSLDEIASSFGISRPTLILRLARSGWEIETIQQRHLKRLPSDDSERMATV